MALRNSTLPHQYGRFQGDGPKTPGMVRQQDPALRVVHPHGSEMDLRGRHIEVGELPRAPLCSITSNAHTTRLGGSPNVHWLQVLVSGPIINFDE